MLIKSDFISTVKTSHKYKNIFSLCKSSVNDNDQYFALFFPEKHIFKVNFQFSIPVFLCVLFMSLIFTFSGFSKF